MGLFFGKIERIIPSIWGAKGHGMIPEIDVWRAIRQHGTGAISEAKRLAGRILDRGDSDGCEVRARIRLAIEALRGTTAGRVGLSSWPILWIAVLRTPHSHDTVNAVLVSETTVSGDKNPKIAVDVGLSAKASLEAKVSTEIPAQSTGRLKDALTDIIRPYTERRGLKADLIRLQREDVLLEIARKATARLEIENRQPAPIPNKFLVPYLEKASLEEPDSALIDRWVDLLVSSAIDPSSAHPRFVQILSELTGREAKLLRRMILNNIDSAIDPELALQDPSYAYQPSNILTIIKFCLVEHFDTDTVANNITKTITTFLNQPGVDFVNIVIRKYEENAGVPYDVARLASVNPNAEYGLEVLQSLSLIKTHNVEVTTDNRFDFIRVSYVTLTPLGVIFLMKCDRDVHRKLGPGIETA